jgi:hypothetical protein
MKPELIAFYFPQFHSIPENDAWWGKGFNDWELVKQATPNFHGHRQPKVPFDGDYYNPCDKSTLKKQIDLARQYGIGGFMFYHYWFDGKLLLEKPLEMFLNNKDLVFPFCICWANETWTRSWIGRPDDVLIKQTHIVDKLLWEKHFNYLLPFFKDERAIKIDDKPVILIYQPSLIKRGSEMIAYWRKLAQQNEINDLYIIAIKNHQQDSKDIFSPYNGILKFQPREAYTSSAFASYNKMNYFSFLRKLPESVQRYFRLLYSKKSNYQIFDSGKLWHIILTNAYKKDKGLLNKDIFESAYFEWDNTPRYKNKSKIYTRLSDNQLFDNLVSLLQKAEDTHSPYVFFNAWNEWSEGAYLEPDKDKGYADLHIVSEALKKISTNTDY